MTSRNPRSLLRALAACLLSTALTAPLAQAADKVELTLYNGQHKEIGEAIAKAYEAKTGIHVNVRKGSSNQLASQVMEEGERSPADLIYTEESPPLNNLGEKGFLAKTDDSTLNMLPPEYVAKDGSWIGVTARVRVVAYNPKLIDEKDLPETVLEFAEPQWQGKVGFVPTSGAFQEQAVAIIKLHGREAAEEWLTGLRAFGKTYTNNMVALKAVENGEIATVLVNNYYWFALQREKGQLLTPSCTTSARATPAASSPFPRLRSSSPASTHARPRHCSPTWPAKRVSAVITQTTAEYPLHKGMVSDRGLKPFDELQAPAITPADIGNAEDALDMERDVGLN